MEHHIDILQSKYEPDEELEEEECEPERCGWCDGDGETGPHGWEYPEYYTCRHCNGSGVARDEDEAYDTWRDDQL